MKTFTQYQAALVVFLLGFLSYPALAADTYLNTAQPLIQELVREDGMDKQILDRIFANVHKNQKVLDLMTNAPERKADWAKYSRIFLGDTRIKKGETFLKNNTTLLAQATKRYGIPANIITSILGVETYYGEKQGGHKIIRSLATLAFDHPTRHKFFRSELKHFLRLSHQQQLPALELSGSYAGAMGFPQFMPSSFASYAVDFNDNGIINIWDNQVDAVGSIANYLSKHGWKKGLPVAYQVHPKNPATFKKLSKNALKPSFSKKQVESTGVDTASLPTVGDRYSMIVLTGVSPEEYWLGTKNFYVISRYNPSYLYTMAIHRLAQRIEPK